MLPKLLAASALLISTAAQAEWKEASSEHFLVYSEGSSDTLKIFTEKLEKFDFLLRTLTKTEQSPSPVKLKIYLMRNFDDVVKTMGFGASGIAGYYTANPRGPMAVGVASTPRTQRLNAQSVLLHEYTHHFMHQYFPASYPAWYSEGFAEYYGQTQVLDSDVIEVGHPAGHRYSSFQGNQWMPLSKMLSARSYADVGAELHLLYAEGWLLTHYLAQNKERAGQLDKYLNLINAGQSYEAAMDRAFGPGAKQLDSELREYSGRTRHEVTVLPFKKINIKPIVLRSVAPAEDALMWQEIALGRGIYDRQSVEFVSDVRNIAQRYPNEPYALSRLVEAERAAGNHAEAMRAVERLLAVKPRDARGLMHEGQLQIEALQDAKSSDKGAWQAARKLITEAHRASPADALILEAFYDSFVAEGVTPPPGAQNALYRAFELVPQDDDLRYKLAADFEQRNMIQEAIAVIKPAAFELHSDEADPKKKKKQEKMQEKYRRAGEQKHESAREMLLRLEKKLPAAQGD